MRLGITRSAVESVRTTRGHRPICIDDNWPVAVSQNWSASLRSGLLRTTSLVALAFMSATAIPAVAEAADWIGGTSTDWFTAGNWSAGVPTRSAAVTIDTATPNPTVIGGAAQSSGVMSAMPVLAR